MQQYLNILAKQMYDIALVRNKNEGTEIDTIGLLKHCAGEVVEATEQAVKFLRMSYITNEGTDFSVACASKTEALYKEYKESLSSELADIIACALIVAGKNDLDIQHAVTKCLNKNRKRAEREQSEVENDMRLNDKINDFEKGNAEWEKFVKDIQNRNEENYLKVCHKLATELNRGIELADQLTKVNLLLKDVYKIAMDDWNDPKWHDQVLRKAREYLKEIEKCQSQKQH